MSDTVRQRNPEAVYRAEYAAAAREAAEWSTPDWRAVDDAYSMRWATPGTQDDPALRARHQALATAFNHWERFAIEGVPDDIVLSALSHWSTQVGFWAAGDCGRVAPPPSPVLPEAAQPFIELATTQDELIREREKRIDAETKSQAMLDTGGFVMGNGRILTVNKSEKPDKPKRLSVIDSEAFAATTYQQNYLVKGILCEGQNAILGGQSKTLKTAMAVDLVVSLGTATPFLGKFDVPAVRRVGILSGESGEKTIQETAFRVCAHKGIELRTVDAVWGFRLPQLSAADDLLELRDLIAEQQIKVLVIDPVYLCLLDDASANQASNVMGMGPRLLRLTELLQQTGCTIICVHHSRKNRVHQFDPMELEDLAMAGFAEWARQWILLARREAYEQGTGEHRLWLNVGGSAGHNGLWGLDISEGHPDLPGGRQWAVDIMPGGDLRKEQQNESSRKREEQQEEAAKGRQLRIIETLRKYPEGLTKSQLSAKSGVNPAHTTHAIEQLIDDDVFIECEIMVGNRKNPITGYRLKHGSQTSQTSQTTQTDSIPVSLF